MADIKWQNPPDPRQGGRQGGFGKWAAIAALLRDHPGQWALVATQNASGATAHMIKVGKLRAFEPAGSFEATSRRAGEKVEIYARFVGEAGEYK